jgi:hypothetical protein
MIQLTGVLTRATQSVGAGYFHLSIDGGGPIYRERVYCYELYHQMRCEWPVATEYYLNGEVDKAGHPILAALGADHVKPDLLVHRPGYMGGNHAIIEVKSSQASASGITKDLENLSLFVNRVEYQRAIYLVYGEGIDDTVTARIRRLAAEIPDLAPIELWAHRRPGEAAAHIETLQRRQL